MTHTTTPLICSQCGEGNYAFNAATGDSDCTNPTCDHTIARGDVVLDDGESLTFAGQLLAVRS